MTTAIIYARFSFSEQEKGDSIIRQKKLCLEYCDRENLEVEAIRIDKGRSAFHGQHREATSEMGKLEREVINGEHVGKVLVLEHLNRFSRQDHNETYDLMRLMTRNGVSVVSVVENRVYEAYGSIDFAALIELIVRARMNHEESLTKSRHGKAKWESRRERMAEGKPVSALCPAWLRLSADRSKYEVVDAGTANDRGAIINQMYQWADEGLGSWRIARRLNQTGIKPWGRFTGRTPKGWSRGTIARILTDIAVTGDHQPMQMGEDGKRVPAGDPIRHYYPQVVATDLYQRVSAAANDRKEVRGQRSPVIANLVSGLTRCAVCGTAMNYRLVHRAGKVIVRKGKECAPLKRPAATLSCPNALTESCTNKRSVSYISLEKALLSSALHYALDDGAFARRGDVAKLDVQLADLRRDHEIAYAKAVELWENAGTSTIAVTLAGKKEEEARAILLEIERLTDLRNKAAGQATQAEHLSRLEKIKDDLYADDQEVKVAARLKVAQGFRSIIERIDCRENGTSAVHFIEGIRSIYIEPGIGRREPKVMNFDFVHPRRDMTVAAENAKRVEGYLKRVGSDVKVVKSKIE
jgi:DNA invertase Pin-like site-specific DNA recombinase